MLHGRLPFNGLCDRYRSTVRGWLYTVFGRHKGNNAGGGAR
jgi:hypothetical protein